RPSAPVGRRRSRPASLRGPPACRTFRNLDAVLTTEELEDALSLGYEGRSFEFKGPGDCGEKYFLAKVARAALSMGNLRDGGYVVIGIAASSPQTRLPR